MAEGFITMKISEQSIRKLMANVIKMEMASKQGTKRALKTVATNIMAQSQSEVPRDTETLLSTAYIEEPKEIGDMISINLGYIGEKDKLNPVSKEMASTYAMKVHETPGTSPGGGNYHPYGKWKYLEDPARAHHGNVRDELGRELSIVCSRGVK